MKEAWCDAIGYYSRMKCQGLQFWCCTCSDCSWSKQHCIAWHVCAFGSIKPVLEIAGSRRHCVSSFLKKTFVRKATWPWSPQWATWFPTWQVSIAMMGTRPVWQMVTTDMALALWHPALRPSSLMQWLHITLTTSCHPFHQRRCTKVTQLTWTNLTSHCWQHGAQRWMWASTRRRARRRKESELWMRQSQCMSQISYDTNSKWKWVVEAAGKTAATPEHEMAHE